MNRRDPRVDDYIEKSAEFARPILRYLRETVHEASPGIAEAKRDATRARRIRTAIEWIAEGKPRNWKYMK